MAAKGEVIASIHTAVKFLAQKKRLRDNNLAFGIKPKKMKGTMTQVLVWKKESN